MYVPDLDVEDSFNGRFVDCTSRERIHSLVIFAALRLVLPGARTGEDLAWAVGNETPPTNSSELMSCGSDVSFGPSAAA